MNNGKYIVYDKLTINPHNALRKELEDFIRCIEYLKSPVVDGNSGYNALKVAIDIQNEINNT